MTYTLTTTVALPWAEALDRTRDALSAQGFGILTEINVRSTFEAKLGAEAADAVGDYVILGACNPALASRALAAEPEIGALLPCNVVVRRTKDAEMTTVEAIDPQTMVQLSAAPSVKEVADDAGTRLRKALAALVNRRRRVSAQTRNPETKQAAPGLLIHSAGPLEKDALTGILRSAANARAALGQESGIEVVVQGPGVTLLATNSPAAEAIANAGQLHVDILACGNSMRSAGMEDKDLAPGIGTVPAAIAHLARRQWDGWAYARL